MQTPHEIRTSRQMLGLTQSELARLAGVSLPTIQNLEARRANPTLSTLEAVYRVLGLRFKAAFPPAHWDDLARCGAPLMVGEEAHPPQGAGVVRDAPFRPTPGLLLSRLRGACLELSGRPDQEGQSRRRDAVRALLLALQIHFPSFYGEHLAGAPLVEEILSAAVDGRTIRMAREATAVLATYL
jgi:transcriptional regulator with XRE-family HTH domain